MRSKRAKGFSNGGLAAFFEVGNALVRIRENKLYRATHLTFDRYCQESWNIGRSYAWRVMGVAERLNLREHQILLTIAARFDTRNWAMANTDDSACGSSRGDSTRGNCESKWER
jgi:hypothetical protein